MRTATDFNQYYAKPDPWQISRARFRDRVLRRCVKKTVAGRSVLELGCGEGHLTGAIFSSARSVTGVDLSDVAISRAQAKGLANAQFKATDFLNTSFKGFDVIAAIECLYYLTPADQTAFFDKVAREHSGRELILSAPIVGANKFRRYFTHTELMATFASHHMTVTAFHNLNVNRCGVLTTAAAVAARIVPAILDWLPASMIYQRLYKIRIM